MQSEVHTCRFGGSHFRCMPPVMLLVTCVHACRLVVALSVHAASHAVCGAAGHVCYSAVDLAIDGTLRGTFFAMDEAMDGTLSCQIFLKRLSWTDVLFEPPV